RAPRAAANDGARAADVAGDRGAAGPAPPGLAHGSADSELPDRGCYRGGLALGSRTEWHREQVPVLGMPLEMAYEERTAGRDPQPFRAGVGEHPPDERRRDASPLVLGQHLGMQRDEARSNAAVVDPA